MRKLQTTELNRVSIEAFRGAEKLPIVVILDNVRSGHNVGSVFRSCDAFAISSLCLCGITASPPNREVLKTALGSTQSVEWIYYNHSRKAVEELKQKGFQIILAEHTTKSILLQNFIPSKELKYAVVFGNEVEGISSEVLELADTVIEIPQFGTKHSLNISVAAGIILWHLSQRLCDASHMNL
jgi:tRNA G18 (ribose-2'-O)-methylase SpoU